MTRIPKWHPISEIYMPYTDFEDALRTRSKDSKENREIIENSDGILVKNGKETIPIKRVSSYLENYLDDMRADASRIDGEFLIGPVINISFVCYQNTCIFLDYVLEQIYSPDYSERFESLGEFFYKLLGNLNEFLNTIILTFRLTRNAIINRQTADLDLPYMSTTIDIESIELSSESDFNLPSISDRSLAYLGLNVFAERNREDLLSRIHAIEISGADRYYKIQPFLDYIMEKSESFSYMPASCVDRNSIRNWHHELPIIIEHLNNSMLLIFRWLMLPDTKRFLNSVVDELEYLIEEIAVTIPSLLDTYKMCFDTNVVTLLSRRPETADQIIR